MNSNPITEHREAQPYAAVRMQVAIPFGKFLQPAWSKVHNWLTEQGLSHGPAIIRYLTTDMSTKLDIDVGFVIERAIPGADRVMTDVLPAGQYATLLYTGAYKGKGIFKANGTLIEWVKENAAVWKISTIDGVEWWDSRVEWYLSDPDTEPDPHNYQTKLTFLLADGK